VFGVAQDEVEVARVDEEARALAQDEDGVAPPECVEEQGEAAADREIPEGPGHHALAAALGCDPAFIAVPLLPALGSAIGWNRPINGSSPPFESKWLPMTKTLRPRNRNCPTSGLRESSKATFVGSISPGDWVSCAVPSTFLTPTLVEALPPGRSMKVTPRAGLAFFPAPSRRHRLQNFRHPAHIRDTTPRRN